MTQTNTEQAGHPALLTLLQADLYAREVIAEVGPDFVYTKRPRGGVANSDQCFYVWDGKPDCIVARILVRHGVPISELKRWEDTSANEMCPIADEGRVTDRRSELGRGLVTEEAAIFLGLLQLHQDSPTPTPWGAALVEAEVGHLRRSLTQEAKGEQR